MTLTNFLWISIISSETEILPTFTNLNNLNNFKDEILSIEKEKSSFFKNEYLKTSIIIGSSFFVSFIIIGIIWALIKSKNNNEINVDNKNKLQENLKNEEFLPSINKNIDIDDKDLNTIIQEDNYYRSQEYEKQIKDIFENINLIIKFQKQNTQPIIIKNKFIDIKIFYTEKQICFNILINQNNNRASRFGHFFNFYKVNDYETFLMQFQRIKLNYYCDINEKFQRIKQDINENHSKNPNDKIMANTKYLMDFIETFSSKYNRIDSENDPLLKEKLIIINDILLTLNKQ